MKALGIILILAAAEVFCLLWDAGFKSIELSNLYTQMLTFAMVDLLTIKILDRFSVTNLTRPLQAVLCLSILTHTFAAYAWVLYNQPYLDVYDNFLKQGIFILEIMVFIYYGISNGGGKRARTLVAGSGGGDIPVGAGHHGDNQVLKMGEGR